MKTAAGLILILILILGPLQAANQCTYLPTGLERGVLDELNLVRKDPAGYAFHLEELEPLYRGKERKVADETYLETEEGVSAVEEAIHELQHTRPRHLMGWDACLSLSADAHVKDTGPLGLVGHDSSTGAHFSARIKRYIKHYRQLGENISYGSSTAEDVVRELLIDDGVPGRGHRRNMLDPKFNLAGVSCGPHEKYGTMCVIDFARE